MAEIREAALTIPPELVSKLGPVAFAFPGVGVRLCGHENAFWQRHRRDMLPYLEESSRFAGVDLAAELSRDRESDAELGEREAQLFTYAFNCAVAVVYLRRGLRPQLLAGHSMGIYSALATAEVIDFTAGLAIVERAYEVVNAACPGGEGSMAVIVGLSGADIDGLLALPGTGSVRLVNSNNDTTKVFAGRKSELESFVRAAEDADALKARLLPVASPYHHPELLSGAAEEFESFLRGYSWQRAACPIVSSIDQRSLSSGEDLLQLTARNIATPIDWEKVMQRVTEQGISTVFECGAGLSLTQNGRLMPSTPTFINVKNVRRRIDL